MHTFKMYLFCVSSSIIKHYLGKDRILAVIIAIGDVKLGVLRCSVVRGAEISNSACLWAKTGMCEMHSRHLYKAFQKL